MAYADKCQLESQDSDTKLDQEQPLISLSTTASTSNDENFHIAKSKESKLKYSKLKEKYSKAKTDLSEERAVKLKLYKGLVKLTNELNDAQTECKKLQALKKAEEESVRRVWYEGGMWRGPELLPGIKSISWKQVLPAHSGGEMNSNAPYQGNEQLLFSRRVNSNASVSDLLFDLVIVTAFTRVGDAMQDRGGLDYPSLSYFIVFWLIWSKEANFLTRFDSTDLSSQSVKFLSCFAVLSGSLSCTASFKSDNGERIMIMAAFFALLHMLLHMRVWFRFRDVRPPSEMVVVEKYAMQMMLLCSLEFLTWFVGILLSSETSKYRGVIFLVATLVSFPIPRTLLPNDFYAACSKRGVIFVLLLGFILQSIVLVASPFLDNDWPSSQQCLYLGILCLLLFCIKLLYVDEPFSMNPSDHALLVSRATGFLFHLFQLSLLLSTTVFGSGLNLLTQNYFAASTDLPDIIMLMVCGGFAGVILSVGFMKSLHLRRVPLNPVHRKLFHVVYWTQIILLMGVVYFTLYFSYETHIGGINLDELELLGVLCSVATFLLIISWLDGALELRIYGEGDSRLFRVHPFGLWACLKPGDSEPPLVSDIRHLSFLAPVEDTNGNIVDTQPSSNLYGSTSLSHTNFESDSKVDVERVRLVKFSDEIGVP